MPSPFRHDMQCRRRSWLVSTPVRDSPPIWPPSIIDGPCILACTLVLSTIPQVASVSQREPSSASMLRAGLIGEAGASRDLSGADTRLDRAQRRPNGKADLPALSSACGPARPVSTLKRPASSGCPRWRKPRGSWCDSLTEFKPWAVLKNREACVGERRGPGLPENIHLSELRKKHRLVIKPQCRR